MPPATKAKDVDRELEELARAAKSAHDLMSRIVELLHDRMLKYNWVGFYMLETASNGEPPVLVLGAFQGAMTPHTRIPLHQGICGAAASTGKTVIVDDVAKIPAIWLARSKPNLKSWFRCSCGAKWWANSISTATFRRLSTTKIANWSNVAPYWLANTSKSPGNENCHAHGSSR